MLSIGRQGQLYVVTETPYGTPPALAATDALRHRNITMPFNNHNRVNIVEKKQSPGWNTAARGDRRKTASFTLEALLRPSGTINTLPEADEVLAAAFGAKINTALTTTIASGGAVGGATLTSGTGLAAGGGLLITCLDGKKRVRRIVTVNTGTGLVTWAPNLPSIPAVGAAVKSCLSYKLTSALTTSLTLAHYLKKTDGTAGLKRACKGAVVDKFSMRFDANDEPSFTASGPAKEVVEADAQPGGFTAVGTSQPPSGITGELLVGNTAMKFLKLAIDITNGMFLRNEDYGDSAATEAFRDKRLEIAVALDCRAEDEAALYDLAEAGTNTGIFKQTGYTEGNIIAVGMPQVEVPPPDTDDPDEVVNWPFKGMALESADDANDQIFLYLA